jgi:hypothetical protein
MRDENILAREMLPIWGDEAFLDSGIKFAYGSESIAYRKQRVCLPASMKLALNGYL